MPYIIASHIQRLLKCLQAGDLYRHTVQLLQALQIVNGSDAVSDGMRFAQAKANLQHIYEPFERTFSLTTLNTLLNTLLSTFLSAFLSALLHNVLGKR